MVDTNEFLIHARVNAEMLEAWIEAGWLVPRRDADDQRFSDVDLARAQLIRDLQQDMGVNDEGVSVVLDLIDQIHGLRRTLRELLSAVCAERGRYSSAAELSSQRCRTATAHATPHVPPSLPLITGPNSCQVSPSNRDI